VPASAKTLESDRYLRTQIFFYNMEETERRFSGTDTPSRTTSKPFWKRRESHEMMHLNFGVTILGVRLSIKLKA